MRFKEWLNEGNNVDKSIHVGTIRGIDTLKKTAIGHTPHFSGTGAHRDKKTDKKLRRLSDKKTIKEY